MVAAHALIVGAGIAGPAAAMALQKAGLSSTIYEAYPAPADGLGAFLMLAANGVRALGVLDADAPAAAGFATDRIVLWSGTGKRLGAAVASLPQADGALGFTLKRADLYAALQQQALARGIPIAYGKRLVSAEPSGGGVRVRFADGSDASGDILIGCDGVHSTVRRLIDPQAPPAAYAGLINLGGFVRGVSLDVEPGTYHMIFGQHAFFGYGVAPDGEVWWFANLPEPTEPGRGALAAIDTEQWRQRLIAAFQDDAGPATRLVRATQHELVATAIHTVPRLRSWHTDRLVIIGDAAHAPSPSSGQGASLSIEDAVQLARCLRDQPRPEQAFATFERLRRPRVEAIVKQAARVNSNKAATGAARVLRDLLLPVFLRLLSNTKQQRELYGYRIDWPATMV